MEKVGPVFSLITIAKELNQPGKSEQLKLTEEHIQIHNPDKGRYINKTA